MDNVKQATKTEFDNLSQSFEQSKRNTGIWVYNNSTSEVNIPANSRTPLTNYWGGVKKDYLNEWVSRQFRPQEDGFYNFSLEICLNATWTQGDEITVDLTTYKVEYPGNTILGKYIIPRAMTGNIPLVFARTLWVSAYSSHFSEFEFFVTSTKAAKIPIAPYGDYLNLTITRVAK